MDTLTEEKVREMLKLKDTVIQDYYGSQVKIGVISDTHIGSLFEDRELLHKLYKIFKKEGITNVYHVGDIVDGEKMYKGQEYELYANGATNQIREVVDRYPEFGGITTYFITGNHDLSYWKNSGLDIGDIISQRRKDLVYMGREEVDILIGTKYKKIKLKLFHPGGGTAYALSYHLQKFAESYSDAEKPDILCVGHYHKSEMIPNIRGIRAIQSGSIQAKTPYMRRKRLDAHQGGWILDFNIDRKLGIRKFRGEFIGK